MKPYFFYIPFSGIKIPKKKYIVPTYTLPSPEWETYNQIDVDQQKIITCVTNPLERVVIQYLNQHKSRPALRQFPMKFNDWCFASFDNNRVDKFMQNNPKEFLTQYAWLKNIGEKVHILSQNEFKKTNYSKESYLSYHDNDTLKLITDFYREDFEKYENVYF